MTSAARQWLGTSDPYARLRRIETLDLATDYREITQLFYGDFQSAMFMKGVHGFVFTYAAPRISKVLGETGELESRIAKRVVDTSLLAGAVMNHGFKEAEGRDAARRVNAMHSRYDINPVDFLAVGAEEALGSLDLAERFGWRPVTEKEQEAVRIFYAHQARAFGSSLQFPGSVVELRAFFDDYLDTELHYEPQNERLARALLDWYGKLVPVPFGPLFRTLLASDLDPRIAEACSLRQPPAPAKKVMNAILRKIARKDLVPDGMPSKLQKMVREVYPNGWTYDDLGTRGSQADRAATTRRVRSRRQGDGAAGKIGPYRTITPPSAVPIVDGATPFSRRKNRRKAKPSLKLSRLATSPTGMSRWLSQPRASAL